MTVLFGATASRQTEQIRHSVRMTARFSDDMAAKIRSFPEYRMGAHRITVELRDGSSVTGVLVAWGRDVVRVEGLSGVPFAAEDVVDVNDASDLD